MTDEITKSDALRRWHQAVHYEWEESSNHCGVCACVFRTGDILFVWGDMNVAITKRAFTCVRCGMVGLAEGELKPSGAMVYVEDRHRKHDFDMLSGDTQKALYEGFRILDDMSKGVSKASREGGS